MEMLLLLMMMMMVVVVVVVVSTLAVAVRALKCSWRCLKWLKCPSPHTPLLKVTRQELSKVYHTCQNNEDDYEVNHLCDGDGGGAGDDGDNNDDDDGDDDGGDDDS